MAGGNGSITPSEARGIAYVAKVVLSKQLKIMLVCLGKPGFSINTTDLGRGTTKAGTL